MDSSEESPTALGKDSFSLCEEKHRSSFEKEPDDRILRKSEYYQELTEVGQEIILTTI